MYKVYCMFDSSSQQSYYYLVNESEINDFNNVRFEYILNDPFYKIRLYRQIPEGPLNTSNYCNARENINDLQLLDYNTFLQFYNLMRKVFEAFHTGFTESIQSDLDLILLNWSVS